MFSRTAKYAFGILGYLVENRGTKTSGEQIAQHTGIPANYLSKILNQLRKRGFVDAEKGWGGGFEIRPDALDRPIRDVLEIIDGVDSVDHRDCVFGLTSCDDDNPCPLHPYWERIRQAYKEMVTTRKVSDLSP
jgi:Rrf2 family protein